MKHRTETYDLTNKELVILVYKDWLAQGGVQEGSVSIHIDTLALSKWSIRTAGFRVTVQHCGEDT